MYRNQKKKGKKKERSKTSLNSLALRNARTFRLLSLRVRCICMASFCIFYITLRKFKIIDIIKHSFRKI